MNNNITVIDYSTTDFCQHFSVYDASLSSLSFNTSFSLSIFDSGEQEREFLSSLSAMKDAFSRLQIRQMRQTKLEEYFNQQTSVCLKEKNNEHANREK